MRRTLWRIALTAVTTVGLTTACSTTPTESAPAGPAQLIQPMTKVTTQPRQGYYSDPYPIRVAKPGTLPQSFSGTTSELLSCAGTPTKGCFQATPMTVSIGPSLTAQLAGSTLRNRINNNVFQDDSGAWQLAVTYYVANPRYPQAKAWTAVVHARPAQASGTAVPTDWVADSLVAGDFTKPTKANYDGKYFQDNGKLYLVYSERLTDNPARDGIVAQPMATAAIPAPGKPTVLLAPGDFRSELFFGLDQPATFKLIETGNITQVNGKYVMAYSTGEYDDPGYKIGLAWSDTFLPAAGAGYRKLTMPDPTGVWGTPNHAEVRYLLQSQESKWPNYIAKTVVAPGVPAVIQDNGRWYLTFAGYQPADAVVDPKTGHFPPSSRRPYFAPLAVRIPPNATVEQTSEADLANWLTISAAS
ncbi:family 43 glycosylhydrolase [Amycolatopsis saalfeldensis]|uniref:Glycosyl hydrolases family 43 n=1 Tax=Amycolatopsis saalfeldensis TaxID=394193 RepID=A0A1H8YGD2_9PSEU|nr:family 43 glycosylhydrolase [Amycolatopsis saalfeldensis]SEP51132.1 Glycosyl hydrolases family 43 [Amycolatopsis saalfeldensis]